MSKKIKQFHLYILLFTVCCLMFEKISFSQISKLRNQIALLQGDTDFVYASWSVCVLDVKKDSVIAEYNSTLGLVPASCQKIITTAAALSILGHKFKYETYLEYDGKLDLGTLNGNLYIKGGGDPTLDSETFKKKNDTVSLTDKWAAIIKSKGIKKIKGAVIADASVFEDEMIPCTWIWGDMGNYYGAGASGLSFKDNKFALYFKSGTKKDDSTFITKIFPEIPGMQIINYVKTGGTSDNAFIYGAPYEELHYVRGTIPFNKTNYEVEGSISDPSLFCAQSLNNSLIKIGVVIDKEPTTIRDLQLENKNLKLETRKRLHTQTSRSLEEIIYQTNLQSNNLFAEHLLKTIAMKKTKFGEYQTGINIVTNFWKSKGVDMKGFYMYDGCGLSRWNLVSTKQLSEILRVITLDSVLFEKFYNCLPVAGKNGTLGKLCRGTAAENNIHAKSGYMTRVRSYAGYVTSKKGNLISFAIIVNNYDCSPTQVKEKLEKLMITMAEME
ncbi:MAG: D-alanyl-D-alanine carboxypeptidase/D-alanyl-D-alanine-endopeptidase [Bacteroidota bacterium]